MTSSRKTDLVLLPSQRSLFEIPDSVCYLNCAYMTPLLRAVSETGKAAVRRKSEPWKLVAADFFAETEVARDQFAPLIGATADDIALISSASYGLSTAARALPISAGDSILVLSEEFPSNYYPWERAAREVGARMRILPRPADSDWTAAVLEALDDSVRVAALPHCRWDDGALLDLPAIARACRARGTALVLDVTQSAGAVPISVRDIDPDFLIAATYKWLLGPYGYGFLYVAPRWQHARPLEEVWASRAGAQDFRQLTDYVEDYQAGARRFDMGERSNLILLPMVIRGLAQIEAWGVENIAHSLGRMTDQLASHLSTLGCLALRPDRRAPNLFGVRLPDHAPADIIPKLAAEDIYVSMRGRSLRIAPHLHVTEHDVERFVDAMSRILSR